MNSKKIIINSLYFITVLCFAFARSLYASDFPLLDHERTTITTTEEDFQKLVKEREQGVTGYHQNIDSTPIIPASDDAVLNWTLLSQSEQNRLAKKQEELFRQGKITMIILAGGEATRFGGPKTFFPVSEDLGDFLEIKAANLHWIRTTYHTQVPIYILSSEKRLLEFKSNLADRHFYGLNSKDFKWFVQGTVDTFIPSENELKVHFKGEELEKSKAFAKELHRANPDGVYRFKGEKRKVPGGHFDAIASFIISGLYSEALSQKIEFAQIVNIDNLQAILKNDGMIAYFAERGDDFGCLLAEKNFTFTIQDILTGEIIQNKLIVRFHDNILSFDGLQEFTFEAEKDGYRYVINQTKKTIDVYHLANGRQIQTSLKVIPEIGGTLVQMVDSTHTRIGEPFMKEGFELPLDFDHMNAFYFNTNTMILNLPNLLKFLDVTEEELAKMTFQERSVLVHEKLIKQIKPLFEFKYHEVLGEYPHLGFVKNGKTKIPVVQMTRLMLQATRLKHARVGYIYAPRASIFAPIKELEDLKNAVNMHGESLRKFTLYSH